MRVGVLLLLALTSLVMLTLSYHSLGQLFARPLEMSHIVPGFCLPGLCMPGSEPASPNEASHG